MLCQANVSGNDCQYLAETGSDFCHLHLGFRSWKRKAGYFDFDHVDYLTESQKKTIKNIDKPLPSKKIKQEYMGPSIQKKRYTHNPSVYIKITPEEMERQHQEIMKQMKQDTTLHDRNIIANMKPMSDEKILALYQKGMSIEEIWSKYQVPESIIRHVLAKNQVEIRENKH